MDYFADAEPAKDTLFYRVQTSSSSCRKFLDFGYFCSGWKNNVGVDRKSISSHINNTKTRSGTPFVSMHENPARLIELKSLSKGDLTTVVEVVSHRALNQIGVQTKRITDLCDEYGLPWQESKGQDKGRLVEPSHWVVEHWIPREAIVMSLDVDDFLELAKDGRAIGGEKKNSPPRNEKLTKIR